VLQLPFSQSTDDDDVDGPGCRSLMLASCGGSVTMLGMGSLLTLSDKTMTDTELSRGLSARMETGFELF